MAEWLPPSNPSPTDWASMAAYIDGEGSISIRKRKPSTSKTKGTSCSYVVNIVLSNTDPRMILWAKNVFRVGTVQANCNGERRRTIYHLEIAAMAAEWVLRGCYQFFVIKKEQADVCFLLRENMQPHGIGRTAPLTDSTLEYREGLKNRLHVIKKSIPCPPEFLTHLKAFKEAM